jgi:hypothetical protein
MDIVLLRAGTTPGIKGAGSIGSKLIRKTSTTGYRRHGNHTENYAMAGTWSPQETGGQ